jgi:hypothetical protein
MEPKKTAKSRVKSKRFSIIEIKGKTGKIAEN